MRGDIPSTISYGKTKGCLVGSPFRLIREFRFEELAVEPRDVRYGYALRALHLAGAGVGAVSESEFVHLGDHRLDPSLGLGTALGEEGERTHPRGHEQHGGTVLTGSNASTATYAGSSIHALLSLVVRNEDIVGILGGTGTYGNESAGLEDLVKRTPVDHKVLDDREGGASPRLHGDGRSILEMTHEQLAGSDMVIRTVGASVDIEGTRTAYTLAAVMVEGDRTAALATALDRYRVATLADKLLIQNIKHLEERCIFLNTRNMISLEMSFFLGVLLAPYF